MSDFDYTKDMFGYFTPALDAPFYVYLLLRPDNTPFYVGKGCGDRTNDHEREARKGCKSLKCRTIREIWEQGGTVGKVIIFQTRSEEEAFRVEAQTIQRFWSQLTNVLDRDPFYRGDVPDTIRRSSRKEQLPARIECLKRMVAQLERRERYTRLTEDAEERLRLKAEIDRIEEALDWLVWPPQQTTLWR